MKSRIAILMLMLLPGGILQAQEQKALTLSEAIQMALTNSDQAKIADSKVTTAEAELKSIKNIQYPDLNVGAQYQYVNSPTIDLKMGGGESSETPEVHNIFFGNAMVSMPVFTGFKIRNTIKSGEDNYQATVYNSRNDKEQIAMQTIHGYVNLYKASKTVELLEENLKASQQRVKDFTAKEQQGIIARNDLLKAQLQEASDQLALEDAKKTESILNYRLVKTLKLPEQTIIATDDSEFGQVTSVTADSASSRNDLQALQYQQQAAERQIKVAKSAYYPSLSLMAGYVALDIENIVVIQNAMNVGVGFSYNLASLFKAGSDVKAAKGRAQELQHHINMVTDEIQVQVEDARQNYVLAQKKYEVYVKSEEQAEENYRIVKDKYDNEMVDINDLLQANVDQLQAKINLAYAQAEISEKYYELITALGNLSNTLTIK